MKRKLNLWCSIPLNFMTFLQNSLSAMMKYLNVLMNINCLEFKFNLKWDTYVRDSEENLIKSLSQRITAIKRITKLCNFKTRKMIANGIFLSKLSYLIAVWSNCNKDLLKALQVQQNRVARLITRNNWDIRTTENFKQIGWLSVNQLAFYHKILAMKQIRVQHICTAYLTGSINI